MTLETCDTCGNQYDKAFRVTAADGATYHFDSIECAAHRIAPLCAHCGCRILGHGVEADGTMFCCAHCAEHAGEPDLTDRV